MNLVKLEPAEKSRTYYFKDHFVRLNNVTAVAVSDSGTHRIETADGKKHIVPSGWYHIALDVESWTF